MLYKETNDLIASLTTEFENISESRRGKLLELSIAIQSSLKQFNKVDLTVICTHNSRRSHLAQIWLKAAALYYGIKNFNSYSGGIEVSCFHPNMVEALLRAGFHIKKLDDNINPNYCVQLSDQDNALDLHYSKLYNAAYNPQKNYIAVMVCAEAEQACPVVKGAFQKISIPYQDPKLADNTPMEKDTYDFKIKEIGREILYVMHLVNNQ